MPVNGMNVGVDYSFSYYDGNSGTIQTINDIQDVKIVAQKHDIKSMPYNDVPRFGFIPDGYRIDFTITRVSSGMEDLMVSFSKSFNQGKIIKPGYLNETINNPDGTVSKHQYTNFVVYLTEHGDVSREKVVQQKLEGMASDKVTIA